MAAQRGDTLKSLCDMQEEELKGGTMDGKAYQKAKSLLLDLDVRGEACRKILEELRASIVSLVHPETEEALKSWTIKFTKLMEEKKARYQGFLRGMAQAIVFHQSIEGQGVFNTGKEVVSIELPVVKLHPYTDLLPDDLEFLQREVEEARKSVPKGPDISEQEFLLRQGQGRLENILRGDPAVEADRLIDQGREAAQV